jgi:heme/copper-type cytochrome/quinol oxidase subunit 4
MIQARTSRVRIPMRLLDFSIDLILTALPFYLIMFKECNELR